MSNSNFSFLREKWSGLAQLGELAEKYLYDDPNTALTKLRIFGESMTDYILAFEKVEVPPQSNQLKKLKKLEQEGVLQGEILEILHDIRKSGNLAVHKAYESFDKAFVLIQRTFNLAIWFIQIYDNTQFVPNPYIVLDKNTTMSNSELKKEIDLLRAVYEAEFEKRQLELEKIRDEYISREELYERRIQQKNDLETTEFENRKKENGTAENKTRIEKKKYINLNTLLLSIILLLIIFFIIKPYNGLIDASQKNPITEEYTTNRSTTTNSGLPINDTSLGRQQQSQNNMQESKSNLNKTENTSMTQTSAETKGLNDNKTTSQPNPKNGEINPSPSITTKTSSKQDENIKPISQMNNSNGIQPTQPIPMQQAQPTQPIPTQQVQPTQPIPTQQVQPRDLDKDLFLAIYNHNSTKVSQLLSEGANPNNTKGNEYRTNGGPFRETPLAEAVIKGDPEIVKTLLEAGADAKHKFDGFTFNNNEKNDREIDRLLLSKGADPNFSSNSTPPLQYATQTDDIELVKFFLQYGANVNGRDLEGYTALQIAMSHNNYDMVKVLFGYGADPTLKGGHGRMSPQEIAELRYKDGDTELLNLFNSRKK